MPSLWQYWGVALLVKCMCICRLFRNQEELEKLSELGVLFLLFEMGLELSLDRLKVGQCEQCLGSISALVHILHLIV